MDTEYESKFEEMKKYIPFLENMITRLESTSTTATNPRQAQLDKIRSLRHLLCNDKKRMKMENVLKCEQVLINLYAKVEQRDNKTSDFSIDTPTQKEKSELEAVRIKLKSVVKHQDNPQDTLPEILPRNEISDVHTSGTKEPALFQRRPNLQPNVSNKEAEESKKTPPSSASKRNYTRVLVSPERSPRLWPPSETTIGTDKPLFSRRSPRKSPKRHSPSYYKKERKKSKDKSRNQKDLNITLNVPEESLSSLNTKDILSRIINCSDGDVDIDTLRELRKQILGELKKTGAKDDISDLILKSYNNKDKNKEKHKTPTKIEEIEEGELSDSESEAIESIYGSLVVKEPGQSKISSEKSSEPRKIQICLVINSNNKVDAKAKVLPKQDTNDFAELEMYRFKEDIQSNTDGTNKANNNDTVDETESKDKTIDTSKENIIEPRKKLKDELPTNVNEMVTNFTKGEELDNDATILQSTLAESNEFNTPNLDGTNQFQANFYKPLTEQSNSKTSEPTNCEITDSAKVTEATIKSTVDILKIENTLQKMEMTPEIPLLHERTIEKQPPDNTLSEIDILQALKNEILSEIPVPGTESTTPLLHQPKVMKVANSHNQIIRKKRISIEKYKEKSENSSHLNPVSHTEEPRKEEPTKQTRLKLTDKEYERFFNVPKISFDEEDESLDENEDEKINNSDIYGNLAPKSPDHEDLSNIRVKSPVLIPVDSIKNVSTNKTDIDMRALPIMSPNNTQPPPVCNINKSSNDSLTTVKAKVDPKIDQLCHNRPARVDPRVRRDLNPNTSTHNPNLNVGNPERTPRRNFSSGLPNSTPNPMTPNARAYEMTPTHHPFDEDPPTRKHVYIPSMSNWERNVPKLHNDDLRDSSWNSQTDDVYQNKKCDSYSRYTPDVPIVSSQFYGRKEPPMTPLPSFGRSDCPVTPSHPFGRDCPSTPSHPFGRLDCPPTPSHTFGRSDCPPASSHPFGRLECPPTPSHSFGRLECPPTPNHSFGRIDGPTTPSHPFGRMDTPLTPSHPFGRSDCPSTPSHPFGRTEPPPSRMSLSNKPFLGADCSSTPTVLFGRNDGTSTSSHTPKTNKHHVSVSQPSSHRYGRAEPTSQYNRPDFNKYPRLNRNVADFESKYEERDRSYHQDQDRYRSSSYLSQKNYGNGSGVYRHFERDVNAGKNKYKYFAPDFSGNPHGKEYERRDRIADRSLAQDREGSVSYTKERWYRGDGTSHEEVGNKREYKRSMRPEETQMPDRVSNSTNKHCTEDFDRNTLSVEFNTGRSFTIDTSVNATFQKVDISNEIPGFVNSFDVRKQRAASVERSVTCEFSVGRPFIQPIKSDENERVAFQRASSVGREVFDSNADKRTFQEVKADFKSYEVNSSRDGENCKSNTNAQHDNTHRKDTFDNKKNEHYRSELSNSYSPKKNIRDPRMRKLFSNKPDSKALDNHNKRGIVYSNDNIVTGSILKSGYGVKNYKIPKIKRAVEEKEDRNGNDICKNEDNDKNVKQNSETLTEKDAKIDKLDIKQLGSKASSIESPTRKDTDKKSEASVIASPERRLTRSSKKSKEEVGTRKIKKNKKIIYDSESDDTKNEDNTLQEVNKRAKEEVILTNNTDIGSKEHIETKTDVVEPNKTDLQSDERLDNTKNETSLISTNTDAIRDDTVTGGLCPKATLKTHPSPSKEKHVNCNAVETGSNFAIDELDMFPDNIVSDPVIDNINALIADLDNDLSTSKSDSGHNFTKEITLENMMQNISSPVDENLLDTVEESSKLIQEAHKNSNDNKEVSNKVVSKEANVPSGAILVGHDKCESCVTEVSGNIPTQSDELGNKENKSNVDVTNTSLESLVTEDIDSTTEAESSQIPVDEKSKLDDQTMDGCSTPDSTINTDCDSLKPIPEEIVPGSTNEVTSTELIGLKSGSVKDMPPALDSIGNLLSILQDKTKIKELLHMLGDQSGDNEKIKKKLEKLSEIVSDDEVDEIEDTDNQKGLQESCNKTVCKADIDKDKTDEKETESVINEQSLDSSSFTENNFKMEDDEDDDRDIEEEVQQAEEKHIETKPKNKQIKKTKYWKKAKGKAKKGAAQAVKRITRATAAETKSKVKKPPRELMKLQEDIKEMFIRDDVLSATGIRMCRIAKLVDEKISPAKEESSVPEVGPVVVLEKFKDTEKIRDTEKMKKKKTVAKMKVKSFNDITETITPDKTSTSLKRKPGPKSKTKKKDFDPYAFETDSVRDSIIENASEVGSSCSSDSENDSLSSYHSFGSTELLADIKKKTKRKRRGWQAGVIKSKSKKKKNSVKQIDHITVNASENILTDKVCVPDTNCFIDRNYCFRKNIFSYSCRLCSFTGTDIVLHYRNQHPHFEIPLSRITPEVAKEAIEQCEEVDFRAISKIPSDKYVCTFCFKEFGNSNSVLETFFWHVVSMHTGEYKQNCSQCDNANACPFNLDIPPPPKDGKGQLIGFMCKKCNFTQISLENLKAHVINRHNDEQTAVYIINLSVMSKKSLTSLLRRSEPNEALLQTSDDATAKNVHPYINIKKTDDKDGGKTVKLTKKFSLPRKPPIQSKITFEGDDINSELSDLVSEPGEVSIKIERTDSEIADADMNNEESFTTDVSDIYRPSDSEDQSNLPLEYPELQPATDIVNYPHFKISQTGSRAKEYFCCINENNHFKTSLLISMKKHVQFKHSEPWDGYCYVCKVIVTPIGVQRFIDCLQHYLDKHMDDFPVMEQVIEEPKSPNISGGSTETPIDQSSIPKPYINVRPLSELVTRTEDEVPQESVALPVIQSVMSLETATVETPQMSPKYPSHATQTDKKVYKYEEHQAQVVSKKYYLVIEAMMTPDNLIKVFKCSGRYCLYATNSTEEALAHATTHQRVGGTDALNCIYCDFDSAANAVDLVMHIFKSHGNCQYCCRHCFYRAASSQAVGAHMSRMHATLLNVGTVLRTTTVSTIPKAKVNMLLREQAVSYYMCGHNDRGETCKFRSYTPDKFCEHLLQRHSAASAHPCHICYVDIPTATELIQHMKSHGFRLYQCTWCIHGADNEAEMLAHVSEMHPDKQPQAYIRIITNKDGGSELRVLPLAFLTKHKVLIEDVTPSPTKEHPVREAERSIEMEALIGPFMSDTTELTEKDTEPSIEIIEDPITTSEIPQELITVPEDVKPPVNIQIPELITSSPITVESPELDSTAIAAVSPTIPLDPVPVPTLSVKTERTEPVRFLSENIVVLDSDEEDTPTPPQQPAIINLSDDEVSKNESSSKKTFKMIPISVLLTCPKCKQLYKNMGGFKKHILSCVTEHCRSITCAHCEYVAENLDDIALHYVVSHTDMSTYECGICQTVLVNENSAKKHMRTKHKENILVLTRSTKDRTRFIVTSRETPKERILPKRKLSGPKTDAIPAKRRFEPQEIDQLPITPILDHLVYCSTCEFSTKVRLNMVRHLLQHAEQQPVPQTAPINPVPHLESNEKHFDKMVNLASSSAVNRTPDKIRPEPPPTASLLIPPEQASKYPKYIPDRQRHTCGARGCSYISLDEAMFRRHWDALHLGSNDFHCVHCPPFQHLDPSKPLTATRIITHLKMHNLTLYACSSCTYYHFKREAAERHVSSIHKDGQLMVVREIISTPVAAPAPAHISTAPTMDLKSWQCGLCKFKSMLRPEVVNHCYKFHESKIQFKCAYCQFRTSAAENITNHQITLHADKPENIFYYYYREDSIPDDIDGTPLWMKQRQNYESSKPEVKIETPVVPDVQPVQPSVTTPLTIDLQLVKKEVNEVTDTDTLSNMEDLCRQFGQFCEPNGIKFKCPLCTDVMEDTRELMQSHLYEELNYRKWSCGLCSYKAFHVSGLTEHMTSEHRRQYDHIELPRNVNIEKWVAGILDHQATTIDKHKQNLLKQKIVMENNKPETTVTVPPPKDAIGTYSDIDLEYTFGNFGVPNCIMYCCPKCGYLSKDDGTMRDHLEMELNKIRWCCTNCPDNFQTYHEAQFHCKGHDGPSRPIEAIRDPAMRAAWLSTTIQKQKILIQNIPTTSSLMQTNTEKHVPIENDNSLLVVRYEEKIPTPDQVRTKRKRMISDSEEDRLGEPKAKVEKHLCPHCDFKTSYPHTLKSHMLSHFGLKRFTCGYCPFDDHFKKTVTKHIEQMHSGLPNCVKQTEIPEKLSSATLVCLVCEKFVPESLVVTHSHNTISKPQFSRSLVVPRCKICMTLFPDSASFTKHHNDSHPEQQPKFELHTLGSQTDLYKCLYCDDKFKSITDYRKHHSTTHPNLRFNVSLHGKQAECLSSNSGPIIYKKCARKSTTKLPSNSIAKKSTTKLPYSVPGTSNEEYSYYGTGPSSMEEYTDVTTLMSFGNITMPFSLKQLGEHLNIQPKVKVTDLKAKLQ